MSFWALASGVVGEANNIARERAKAIYEEEQAADALENELKLIEARGEAEFETNKKLEKWRKDNENPAMNLLSKVDDETARFLLQDEDFRTQLGITSDLVGVSNLLTDAAETTKLGKLVLPFEVDFGNKDSVFNGVNQMEMWLATQPNLMKTLQEDEATRTAFEPYMTSLYHQNNLFHHDEFSKTDQDGVYASHAYRDYDAGLKRFKKVAQDLGIISTSQWNTAPNMVGDTELTDNQVLVTEPTEQAGTINAQVLDLNAVADKYGVTLEQLDGFANYHQMPDGRVQIFLNMDTLTYGQDSDVSVEAMVTNEDKMSAVTQGARLLAVNGQEVILLPGGASSATMDAVTNTLNEVGRGTAENNYADEDVGAMRRAVFTIIQPDPTLVGKPPNAQTGVSGVKYATDQGYKVGEFRVQSEATNEAVDMLLELRNIQESYGTTGLSAKLEGFVAGVIGQAGQLRDVFFGRDAPGAELFQNNLADKTTAADLLKTATDVLGVDRIQQLSRIDALRLTLAAKMARAVDPSGRLSNQDFEIQLERLGQSGIFTTQTGAIARLDTVIEEFQNRQKEQEMMAEILGKSSITVEDRRFIQATNYVTKIQRHRKKSGIIAQTVGTDDPAVPTPDPNSDLIEMQDAPGFFQRPGSITPLDAQGNDATEAFMRKYYPQNDGQSS